MKCWECKKTITRATRVPYLTKSKTGETVDSKFRDVCAECYAKLTFNPCHFVEVEKIGHKAGIAENT